MEGIKVLLSDSLCGISGRQAKVLMKYNQIEADCIMWRTHNILFHPFEQPAMWIYSKFASLFSRDKGYPNIFLKYIKDIQENYDIINLHGSHSHHTGELFWNKLRHKCVYHLSGEGARNYLLNRDMIDFEDRHVFAGMPFYFNFCKGTNLHWYPNFKWDFDFYPKKVEDVHDGHDFVIYLPCCPEKHEEINRKHAAIPVDYMFYGDVKGQNEILTGIEQLRREGFKIKVLQPPIVYGIPVWEVNDWINKADIVIDQIKTGYYGFSTIEALIVGKPVLGYWIYHNYSKPPFLNLPDPSKFTEYLRMMLEDKKLRTKLSKQCPAYVQKYHSPEAVSKLIVPIYKEILEDGYN